MLGGRAADLFGRWRVFMLGLGLFSVASLSIVTTTFTEGAERNKALGICGHEQTSMDIARAFTITAGLVVLVYALVDAHNAGWSSGQTIGLLALSGDGLRRRRRDQSSTRRARGMNAST